MKPLRVGLTGGVAAGKSTVASAFARLGVPVHSADDLAHQLTAPGTPRLDEIQDRFGPGILNADGTLARDALARRVFDNVDERRWLEALLHPEIRARLAAAADDCDADYCILEIPLLERKDIGTLVDRVLVVDVPEATQLGRLQHRDSVGAEGAQRVLGAQASREERLALADDVLDNSGDPGRLDTAVTRLDRLYRDIASHGDPGRPGLHLD